MVLDYSDYSDDSSISTTLFRLLLLVGGGGLFLVIGFYDVTSESCFYLKFLGFFTLFFFGSISSSLSLSLSCSGSSS
jgi:hypothetical protein